MSNGILKKTNFYFKTSSIASVVAYQVLRARQPTVYRLGFVISSNTQKQYLKHTDEKTHKARRWEYYQHPALWSQCTLQHLYAATSFCALPTSVADLGLNYLSGPPVIQEYHRLLLLRENRMQRPLTGFQQKQVNSVSMEWLKAFSRFFRQNAFHVFTVIKSI